ncbi:MAG: lipoprotein insertase outer membrane protein LolB [Gammaproteobacteria bacterium]|nr:lipoprotein insertase outer membrane protein LolB [Gammaproteobacteria bacterium]
MTLQRALRATARLLALAAAGMALAGCAPLLMTADEQAARDVLDARHAALEPLADWQAVGRLSVQSGEQAWHASLVWRQEADRYRIRLLGPLGQGGVEIAGGPDEVTLRTGTGGTYSAADPETLMRQRLGWWAPLRGLRYWLLGLDDPEAGRVRAQLDAEGRLASLSQDGWDVRYLGYLAAEPVALPARVELERNDLRAKVVVSRWDLEGR